ncbi:hypothetical protein H5U35_09180, partial [Candidatus Aerophobetes bacterium]|nr:hypothetical protein [Candidatus Aerophobetes bacterium]
ELKGPREIFALVTVIIFIIVFAVFAFSALTHLPPFGYPVMKVAKNYIENGLMQTGASNLVTAVLLDFRAYDTLGEATVLFTAILGTLIVLREIGRKER